jgi:anaerobic magnesium-protoporphyrin IX monomethyl ester cyclase
VKVLLTHGYFIREDAREQLIMKPYPPLGLLYVAAHLRACGHEVMVYDSTFGDREELLQRIGQEQPGCIAIYVNLMTRANVVALMERIRALKGMQQVPIVLGGPETRNHAANFLAHGATVCVVGEGERTAEEVVAVFDRRDLSQLPEVAGIAYLDASGQAIFTKEREKLKEVDALPLPARDLIDIRAYQRAWKERHGYSALSVSTMRGCPYTCRWCSRAVYGLSYRRRSAACVVDELAHLVATYKPDRFWFVDDVFTISHKWMLAFTEELERRDLRIAFECITRADRMNTEAIALLKRSGCVQVWIGAESGSQRIIDAMDRRVDVQQVRTMLRESKVAGIGTGTFIMLGYPGETEADILETVEHLKQSDPDQFTITLAYPIAGTELHAEVREDMTNTPEWAKSSDRDQDFRRAYRKGYYRHAIRYLTHAVHAHQQWNRGKSISAAKHGARAAYGRLGMLFMK